jgi:hypothetical protein
VRGRCCLLLVSVLPEDCSSARTRLRVGKYQLPAHWLWRAMPSAGPSASPLSLSTSLAIGRPDERAKNPSAVASEMALPHTSSGSAYAGRHGCAHHRSGDWTVDLADRRRGVLRQAARIAERQSGSEGRCAEKLLARLGSDASAGHAVSRPSSNQACCKA